jgi:RNA methyltransferase, TrmH family
MLSKNKIKLIQSLNKKKTRDELKLFVAEGAKTIAELLNYNTEALFIATSKPQLEFTSKHGFELISTEQEFIDKASLLKTPQQAIAVFKQPKTNENYILDPDKLVLALDDVQDPGNLGTMIRLANWFGIETILCSPHTADCYNPKVIQATMGAIGGVSIHYINLEKILNEASKKGIPIYGTFLDGQNIYTETIHPKGIIVMGNEGNGISDAISRTVSQRLLIPDFAINQKVESLNVSIATAIVLSEFRRRSTPPVQ